MQSLTQNPYELTSDALLSADTIVTNILSAAVANSMGEQIGALLDSIHAVMLSSVNSYQQSGNTRRRLLGTVNTQVDFIVDYGQAVMDNMVFGQQAVDTIYDQFRVKIQVLSTTTGELSVATSTTSLEDSAGVSSGTSVQVSVDSTYADSAKVTLIELKSYQFSGGEVTTNPLVLVLSDTNSCSSNGECQFTVGMTVLSSQSYVYNVPIESYETLCDGSVAENHTYQCAYGSSGSVNTSCSLNEIEHVVNNCDANLQTPACYRLNSGVVEDGVCSLNDATDSGLSCSCTHAFADTTRRNLVSAGAGSIEIGGFNSYSYVQSSEIRDTYAPSFTNESACVYDLGRHCYWTI